MQQVWVVVVVALGALICTSDALKNIEEGTVDDEFPFVAVSDEVAGTPGSSTELKHVAIGAAHTTGEEAAKDSSDCDMDMTNGDDATSETVEEIKPAIEEGEFYEPFTSKDFDTFKYRCEAVSFGIPVVKPPVNARFDVGAAQSAGNDKRGIADSSEFTKTDCSCVCSGHNMKCGIPGSHTYFKNVATAKQCALMMCHSDKFAGCAWGKEMVSIGQWKANTAAFNSTILSLVVPSPSTSPSPSPSISAPLPRDVVVGLKATSLFGNLVARACVKIPRNIAKELTSKLLDFFKTVDVTVDLLDVCHPNDLPSPSASPSVAPVDKVPDSVKNELAGYARLSPLASDLARYATESMDDNVLAPADPVLLVGLKTIEDDSITVDATFKLVAFFTKYVDFEEQCGEGALTVIEIVHSALHIEETCDAVVTVPFDSLADYSTTIYRRLKARLHISPSPSPSPLVKGQVDNSMKILPPECFDREFLSEPANEVLREDTSSKPPGSRPPLSQKVEPSINLPIFGLIKPRTWDKVRTDEVEVLSKPAPLNHNN